MLLNVANFVFKDLHSLNSFKKLFDLTLLTLRGKSNTQKSPAEQNKYRIKEYEFDPKFAFRIC